MCWVCGGSVDFAITSWPILFGALLIVWVVIILVVRVGRWNAPK